MLYKKDVWPVRSTFLFLSLSIYFAIALTRMDLLGALLVVRILAWVLFLHHLSDISEQNIMTERRSPATRRRKDGARCQLPRGLLTCI